MKSFIENREVIEWSNTWIENATDCSKKRILIIGDSGAREFRSSFSKFLPNYAVDFIGSSSIFEDSLLYNLCDMFLKNKEYSYSLIILNIGGKHGYYLNTAENSEHRQRYIESFDKFFNYIAQVCPNIVGLTTAPSVRKDNIKKFDENINREIRMRNNLLSDYMSEKHYNTIDLYDFVLKNKFKYRDNQHFATKNIQRTIAKFIIQNLIKFEILNPADFRKKKTALEYVNQSLRKGLTYIHTYIHTYIYAYIHICIHTLVAKK